MKRRLSRTEVIAKSTIGAVVKHIAPEATFALVDVAVDGLGVVVATTDLKVDQVVEKCPVMVDITAVVIEVVAILEDEKNSVVVLTEVITKVIEVVEVDIVAEGEVVTSLSRNELTK